MLGFLRHPRAPRPAGSLPDGTPYFPLPDNHQTNTLVVEPDDTPAGEALIERTTRRAVSAHPRRPPHVWSLHDDSLRKGWDCQVSADSTLRLLRQADLGTRAMPMLLILRGPLDVAAAADPAATGVLADTAGWMAQNTGPGTYTTVVATTRIAHRLLDRQVLACLDHRVVVGVSEERDYSLLGGDSGQARQAVGAYDAGQGRMGAWCTASDPTWRVVTEGRPWRMMSGRRHG